MRDAAASRASRGISIDWPGIAGENDVLAVGRALSEADMFEEAPAEFAISARCTTAALNEWYRIN